MIFHTASDPVYYNKFFSIYQQSIQKNFNNPIFSLNYIDKDQIINQSISNLTYEHISLSNIEQKYNVTGRDALGYYAISRFTSLPNLNDHVIVSDIDIAAINNIDEKLILNLLNEYKVINITRKKPNGLEGGMAIIIIHKDICNEVANNANKILASSVLKWNTDVQVKKFLLKNYKNTSILQMHDISKNSNLTGVDAWFAFSKLGNLKETRLRSVL